MYERIKGFRDFYPEEMRTRRAMTDELEDAARRYGFREIGTPALERTRMYAEKSGEEITDELFHFTDQGGREVAMAPELTPTVARMVVAKQQELSKPIKWFSTRPFWRYEAVQQGRFREFYQTNVDVFGSNEPEADAEILAYCVDALSQLGLEQGEFEFRVSHRDILGGLLESISTEIDTHDAIRAVDKREKIETGEYYGLLTDAGLTRSEAERFDALLSTDDLDELVDFAGTDRVESAVKNLENVLAAAENFGAREHCTISLETARGLDYYTGVVFECFDATGDVSRSVFGGGRYDDLIEGFGGQPTPAVGVALGHETLSLLLDRADAHLDEGGTDYYVLSVGDTRPVAARIARDLRERGHVVETDLSDRSFGAQMNYADGIDAGTVIIVGERDLENDEITVKDMESGEQTAVAVDSFPGDLDRPAYDEFA